MTKELREILGEDSWHATYIGYTIPEILKLEERIVFDITAEQESENFRDWGKSMTEESYETHIKPEKTLETREIERYNNWFIQKIDEIKRLHAGLGMNVRNLQALAVKAFEEGYVIDVNDMSFSDRNTKVDFFSESIGWDHVENIVISKGTRRVFSVENNGRGYR